MQVISRKEITEDPYREILDVETHHEHEIYKDNIGTLRWKENSDVVKWVNRIGMNEIMMFFECLGLNNNSELVRKLYRDIGYTLFGYWEVFYWEANNDIANDYDPHTFANSKN